MPILARNINIFCLVSAVTVKERNKRRCSGCSSNWNSLFMRFTCKSHFVFFIILLTFDFLNKKKSLSFISSEMLFILLKLPRGFVSIYDMLNHPTPCNGYKPINGKCYCPKKLHIFISGYIKLYLQKLLVGKPLFSASQELSNTIYSC